jgi:hypothetical protein
VAQRTFESAVTDVFRFYEPPPKTWSFKNKAERRRILRHVYAGSKHVNIDGIEAEAVELMEKDPAQAERFFGNRIVYGAGAWIEGAAWETRKAPRDVPDGEAVVAGFDGSDLDDWTGLRLETRDGYQFTPTYGPDKRPTIWNPADWGGQVPRLEVAAAVDEIMARFKVIRFYGDPPFWTTELDQWSEKYGERVVMRWATWRVVQMHAAAERMVIDVSKADSAFTHDGCEITERHIGNTRRAARNQGRYVLEKPSRAQKIDLAVTSIICHEAACDVTAAGLWPRVRKGGMVVYR